MRDIERAKAIIAKYDFSHFHLARENPKEYKEYLSYRVSKKQERLWVRDCLKEMIEQLNAEYNNKKIAKLAEKICDYAILLKDKSVLFFLCEYITCSYIRLDTYTLIRISNAMMNLSNYLSYTYMINREEKIEYLKCVINILKKQHVKDISQDYMIDNKMAQRLLLVDLEDDYNDTLNFYRESLKRLIK